MGMYGEVAVVSRTRMSNEGPAVRMLKDLLTATERSRVPLEKSNEFQRSTTPAHQLVGVYEKVEETPVQGGQLLGFVALNSRRRPTVCYVFPGSEEERTDIILDLLLATYRDVIGLDARGSRQHRRWLGHIAHVSSRFERLSDKEQAP